MTARFRGKVALVTGAADGIGLATANRLMAEGATVVAGVLEESQRAAVVGLDAILLDVRSATDWRRALAHVATAHGGLDVLVNNAGIHRPGTAEETTAEAWDDIMAVNLWGTFLGCREAIPQLRARGGGAIVNVASIAGIRGTPGGIAYTASKGGVVAMTMALAIDHVADRIRINCVCPGAVATGIIERLAAQAADPGVVRAAVAARQPMGRMASPEEIAAAIAFLASDDASFMTGVALPVDGGRSARG